MVKITEPVGATRTFKNGAVAKVVNAQKNDGTTYKRLQIVKGADPAFIKNISRKRKSISPKAAQTAFSRYWNARIAAAGTTKKAQRGVLSARARDKEYTRERFVRDNTSYLRNPGKFEYRGVDTGPNTYKKASGARLAALKRGQAALRARRSGGRQAGGYFF